MKTFNIKILLIFSIVFVSAIISSFDRLMNNNYISIVSSGEKINMFFKDDKNKRISSLKNLRKHLESKGQKLAFAMNGGMYGPDRTPVGLYIENSVEVSKVDISNGEGNFYMKPNGIFYITENNEARIVTTGNFKENHKIKYATQSGPMLLIEGTLHPQFKKNSKNINIRNGVGILPDGRVILAMSKEKVNFYDFAMYFKELGCQNALYLDGLVSRTYAPAQDWIQEGGNFGVMIAVIKD